MNENGVDGDWWLFWVELNCILWDEIYVFIVYLLKNVVFLLKKICFFVRKVVLYKIYLRYI